MPFRTGPLLTVHDFCQCYAEGREYGGFYKILDNMSWPYMSPGFVRLRLASRGIDIYVWQYYHFTVGVDTKNVE